MKTIILFPKHNYLNADSLGCVLDQLTQAKFDIVQWFGLRSINYVFNEVDDVSKIEFNHELTEEDIKRMRDYIGDYINFVVI